VTGTDAKLGDYSGTSVTVMGLGLFGGGASVARFFAERGAEVTVTDLRSAEVLAPAIAELEQLPLSWVLGEHREIDFQETDLVVANPAVPPRSPFLELARQAGVPITSEMSLFIGGTRARLCAVTGTQGKSSTCNLLTGLLLASNYSAYLGGNIGGSLLDRVDEFTSEDVVVLELSSYQLEALALEPEAARCFETVAILNILEDHLARHGSVAAYAKAKCQLLEHVAPGGTVLLPADDPQFANWIATDATRIDFSQQADSAPLHQSATAFHLGSQTLAQLEDLRLPGQFQRVNALVALGMAHTLGVPADMLGTALRTCRGLPHRLENLGVIGGRRIWDNAISTTPDSTVAAMLSLEPGFTLLLGGEAKGLGLEELARRAAAGAKHTICFGQGAPEFHRALTAAGAACESANTMHEAVGRAFACTEPGQEILFSPAAASFDAYPNFQARALDFRAAVRAQAGTARVKDQGNYA